MIGCLGLSYNYKCETCHSAPLCSQTKRSIGAAYLCYSAVTPEITRRISSKMTSLLDKIVSYGPELKVFTKDQAARSVVVENVPPEATADGIVSHFLRLNDGLGNIHHVHIPAREGTAVITFESSEGLSFDLKLCDQFRRILLRIILL